MIELIIGNRYTSPGPIITRMYRRITIADAMQTDVTAQRRILWWKLSLGMCCPNGCSLQGREDAVFQSPVSIRHGRIIQPDEKMETPAAFDRADMVVSKRGHAIPKHLVPPGAEPADSDAVEHQYRLVVIQHRQCTLLRIYLEMIFRNGGA